MTTKKILLIVGGVLAVLGLVAALFVGGIVWVAFSTIGKSEAAQTAKTFLRRNETLKSDICEVRDFGFWVTGNINSHNSDGEATLNLKVIGAKKTVPASVNLTYRSGRDWIVVGATYNNDAGQTVNLINPYETDAEKGLVGEPSITESNSSGGAVENFSEGDFAANVLQAKGLALVVLVSQYSLDSRALDKTLDELSEKYSERVTLVRYSVDEQPTTLKRFNIETLPTLIIYTDGEEQERLAGAVTKQNLARLLDKYLKTE